MQVEQYTVKVAQCFRLHVKDNFFER